MITQTLGATYRDGVLHLSRPLDLADGAQVEVMVSTPDANPPQPTSDLGSADHEEMHRIRMEALQRILALPMESDSDGFSGTDHDRILYGGPDGAR